MIKLDGVSKQYIYGARVFAPVDMTINDGEIVALLGDELSGKTTFLKVVAGVTDSEGKVLFDGEPLAKKPDDVIMIFDDLALFANRSCYYNLAYPLKIRGANKDEIDKRVKAAAEKVGITASLYFKARKLDSIDKKRLAIARLFLRDFKVALVDDITRGLKKEECKDALARGCSGSPRFCKRRQNSDFRNTRQGRGNFDCGQNRRDALSPNQANRYARTNLAKSVEYMGGAGV